MSETERSPVRLVDYFHKGMERDPDRAAFVDEEQTVTFRETDHLTERIAAGLHALGLADGVRVAVFSPNDAMAFVALLGAVRGGGVWLPVNVRNPAEVNAHFLTRTDCRVLFFHSTVGAEAREMAERVPTLDTLICLDGPAAGAAYTLTEVTQITDEPAPEIADDPDRPAIIASTGGTTGLAKAAVWSNAVFETTVATVWNCFPTTSAPVHLVAAPMTHGAGAVALWMIPGGATNVILRKADPAAIMAAIEQHRVTHLYLPPTLIYMLLAHPDIRRYDFSSLEYLIIAAAPIAPEKLREAMEIFPGAVCQTFGQAEAPMILTHLSWKDLTDDRRRDGPGRLASCGRATLHSRVEIMDGDGALLPAGGIGEIVARSGLVMAGYLDDPQATREVSKHGWHHTGDIGFKDDDGFVYIVDRKKDMIITGGFNVFSAEVEQVILAHPAVQDCAVIGAQDDKWGEAVTAVVQLKPGHVASVDEIRAAVRADLGGVQTPKIVEFWADLPRSPNGKVLKTEIRQRFWPIGSRTV